MRVILRDVWKSRPVPGGGIVTLLRGIDLELESGSHTLITGTPGSGKTTLLGIIGGLSRPTSGTVLVTGGETEDRVGLTGGRIGFAFQDPLFIPELTVRENLLLPSLGHGDRGCAERGDRLLRAFELEELFDSSPALLSGSEKRRLNLARALLPAPRLLILDEPTAGLGEGWGERALGLVMAEVHETGATVVMAAGDRLPWSGNLRQIRMERGKVIEDGNRDH